MAEPNTVATQPIADGTASNEPTVVGLHTVARQPIVDGAASNEPAVLGLVVANTGELYCTATLVGRHTVITAAHCVSSVDIATIRVQLGTTIARAVDAHAVDDGELAGTSRLPSGDDDGTQLRIADARIHPGFDPGGRDIALLTLRDPAPTTIMPFALSSTPLDASFVGTTLDIVGFGLTGPDLDDAGIQRAGTSRIAAVGAEEIVLVGGPSLACLGDSGGPALIAATDASGQPARAVAGVLSRTDSQCDDQAIYTRVDAARDIFVDPYLTETAPGAAQLGDECFYAAHCGEGVCRSSDNASDEPGVTRCLEPAGCAGCSSEGANHDAVTLTLVLAVVVWGARRAGGGPVRRATRIAGLERPPCSSR